MSKINVAAAATNKSGQSLSVQPQLSTDNGATWANNGSPAQLRPGARAHFDVQVNAARVEISAGVAEAVYGDVSFGGNAALACVYEGTADNGITWNDGNVVESPLSPFHFVVWQNSIRFRVEGR